MMALLHGIFPYQHAYDSWSDIQLYSGWAHSIWSGASPYVHGIHVLGTTVPWLYPPGILPLLVLPAPSFGVYVTEFLSLALAVDALTMRHLKRSGRPLGTTIWLVGPIFLGPIFWARLDVFVAAALVAGVLAIEKGAYGRAGGWLCWAGLLKLWPFILFAMLARTIPASGRRAFFSYATTLAGVLVLPVVLGGGAHGLWNVLTVQTHRGVEFESIFAVPLYALTTAGHAEHLVFAASVEFDGGAAGAIADVATGLLALGLTLGVAKYLKRPAMPSDVAAPVLVLVIIVIMTSKVLSTQYLAVVIAGVALAIDRRQNNRRLAIMTLLLLLVTQMQFPFGFWRFVLVSNVALELSTLHALILIAFAITGFVFVNSPGKSEPRSSDARSVGPATLLAPKPQPASVEAT